MKTYRVAILGCRGRGEAAARAYHAHPRTEIVALCDLLPERLQNLGGIVEVGPEGQYTDLDKMMRETKPDIVAIPVGTEFHHDLLMRVLAYGANVEVEKPICVDLEQADEVLAKAKELGARVAVHHQGRAGALMRAIVRAVDEGQVGKLRYLYASGKGYYGGYGLLNIGTHLLSNLTRIAGKCRAVSAFATTNGRPITPQDVLPSPSGMGIVAGEFITANLMFDNGVTATLLQHRFPEIDTTAMCIELYGTEGRIICRQTEGAWILSTPHYLPDGQHDNWQALEGDMPPHYNRSSETTRSVFSHIDDCWFVEEYVRALDEGRDHLTSGEEGTHVLEIMMGIFESAAYNTTVQLPQTRRDHPLLRWRKECGLSAPDPMPRAYEDWLKVEDKRLGRT